jgi:predicted ester cyclase
MVDNQRKKEILTAFIREVWEEGNLAAADKYLTAGYTIHHDPGDPWDQQVLDLQGYKERVRLSRAPFPDQRFEIQELFADGKAVVMTWLWTGTHLGEIAGFAPTGKQIKMSGATVYYFDEDRISGHWQITDRLGVYQQLRQAAACAGSG